MGYDISGAVAAINGDFVPQDHSLRIEVTERVIAIGADVHLPYHDADLLDDFFHRALLMKAEAIVWLGDLMDMPTHSSWGQDDYGTTFEAELSAVEKLLRVGDAVAGKQYWSLGNHEVRFMRRNQMQFGMDRLARMAGLGDLINAGRLVTSDNPTLDYRSGTSRWMLTHPRQYGNTPLKVPGDIADRYERNIISAHAHHWGKGTSPSGKYTVVESGGLFKQAHIRYIQHGITNHRAWVQGYVMLDHGQEMLYR